jgi:ubiquinone/menaquinone biosynthesis C-methylase UbiE
LPEPESLKVGDAENLPFAADSFDLGYSWGVLHHTPDTEKAISELVRVIRPGGEIKIMLYNRHSLCAFRCWLKNAALKGRPWKGLHWVLWNYIESVGTKGYTTKELQRLFASLPVTGLHIETYLTSADFLARKQWPFRLLNSGLRFLNLISGNRLGWFHVVAARKS